MDAGLNQDHLERKCMHADRTEAARRLIAAVEAVNQITTCKVLFVRLREVFLIVLGLFRLCFNPFYPVRRDAQGLECSTFYQLPIGSATGSIVARKPAGTISSQPGSI